LFEIDPSWYQVDLWLIIVVVICIVAFVAFAINRGIRAHRLQASAGREDLIGKIAEVRIALEPKGIVFIQGERWAAISEAGQVESGEEVIITKVAGLKLYVTKKE
jgi:membrane-bound ClpP family serine protease